MANFNFLQRLIKALAPSVYRPVPTGVLYVLLQSVSREISGECPWDTGSGCYKNYTQYWSLKCRNILCPGYRHPVGLIAYTSRSADTSSVDNRFDYSSFRYISSTGDDWIPVGTLGVEVLFDFGDVNDSGGFGGGFFGARYWGDNAYSATGLDVQIGDKWDIVCHTSSTVLGTDGNTYQCKLAHTSAVGNRPITGGTWSTYWQVGGLDGEAWASGLLYDVASIIKPPAAYVSNIGSYNAVSSQGTYTGDHDTTYTVEIIDFWGYVQNYEDALAQISLSTCTDVWLDFWGEYFGLDRLLLVGGYETDSAYRARILKEITRAKGTKAVLLDEAKTYFDSDLVTITEYSNTSTGPPKYIRWDGPHANGLWPWQFYINLPTQKSPSAKFIKTGSNLEEAGEIYSYEGGYGYYAPYGGFIHLTHVSPAGGLGGNALFSIPTNIGDCALFGCQYKFSGARFTFLTPGVGGTYIWEYWNGASWTTFTPGTTMRDTTLGLTQAGGVHWLMPESSNPAGIVLLPTPWKADDNVAYNIPNTGSELFWARCRVTAVPTTTPVADQVAILHVGSTNRGVYVATEDLVLSGVHWFSNGVDMGYLHQPASSPLVSVYVPANRDKNNIYLYREVSFAKPIWETGLQDLIDRLKTAGTTAIINPMD